ncbi:RNA polymerase I-specific transcription initiation factor RRN6-like protein [Trichophaea hybrida]|nr:RNA polymerase I-specific transcription initiation factor RRN6-like protein [Trichophaea hybrida]
MGPALEFIDNYIEESQLLAVNTNVSDPGIGRLMAFGWATDKYRHINRVKFAAFASGKTGSDLVLAEMGDEERTFKGIDGRQLLAPHVIPGTTSPHHLNSPIRQICSARNPYHGEPPKSRLAVRTSGFTRIYRVIAESKGASSRLSLQPLVTRIPFGSDGTVEHADVAFNPWYFKQFGIIDQRGDWRVLDLEGSYEASRRGFGLMLSSVANGRVTTGDELKGHGWGRITWGGDLNTVMTCDRHTAALFDIRTSAAAPSIVLPVDRDRSWILDLQRGPPISDSHIAFVLTSSHISQVDVRQSGRTLLSWPHGRHRDDVSLYLDIFRSEDVTTAVIGSRMTSMTTCYQFSSWQDPAVLGDPFMLTSPLAHEELSRSASSMSILPCSLQSANVSDGPQSQDVNLFVGFSIDKELSVSRRIYSTRDELHLAHKRPEFVIDSDSDDADKELPSSEIFHSTSDRHIRKPNGSVSHRRANLFELYNATFQDEEELRTVQGGDATNSITGYCARLTKLLMDRVERGNLGISSLIDDRAPSLLFDQLSSLETGIETLLSSLQFKDSCETKLLIPECTFKSLLSPPTTSSFSVQTLYDNLINTRVTSLPETIPGRVRLRRERLSRLIATEVLLASIGVNVKPTAEQLTPPPQTSQFAPITPPPDSTEPLQRIRAYAHIQTRIQLPEDLVHVLDSWKVGEDPSEFEFFVDPEEGVPRYRRDRRKVRKEKQQRLGEMNRVISNDGLVSGFGGSQPPMLMGDGLMSSQQQQMSQSQSQSQGSRITMSQVEKGKHGGRKQKKRKTGF